MTPFSELNLTALRVRIREIGEAHLPDAGDWHAFSETAAGDLEELIAEVGLDFGCSIAWESDGEHNIGILVVTPDGSAHPVPDPFNTDGDDCWDVDDDAIKDMMHVLLNLRAKYGPAIEAAKSAFEKAMRAS